MAEEQIGRHLSPYRWVILFLASFQIFSINYAQFQVSALSHLLMPLYGLGPDQMTSLLLAPLLSGVMLSVPGGIACDTVGPRVSVGIAAALSAIAVFVRVFADSYPLLFCTMFVLGFCPAVLQASCIKVFDVWFGDHAGFAMGVFFAGASLGGATAQVTSNLFYSMHSAFMSSALIFTASVVMWMACMRDLPSGGTPPSPSIDVASLLGAGKSPEVWLIACAVGLGMATSTAYMGLFPQASMDLWGVDAEAAGVMAAALFIGSIAGALIAAPLHDALGHPRAFLLAVITIGAVLKAAPWASLDFPCMWMMLLANGAFGAAAGPILEALPAKLPGIGRRCAGSAGGIIGSASLACSFFLPVCITHLAGSDYGANMIMESAFFLLSAIPVVFLGRAGKKKA